MKKHSNEKNHSIISNYQKLRKLQSLLQNSKISNTKIFPVWSIKDSKQQNLSLQNHITSNDWKWKLSFSLQEKPVNLLFSIDQFLFEFSKKTYQQKKTGDFFQQLKERKKFSLFYGHLTRKQLVNLFNKVKKMKGDFSKSVFSLLERRLDVVLYRSGITKTIAEARQLIKHQKILVNDNFVNVPSYLVNPGEILSLVPETQEILSEKFGKSSKNQLKKNYPNVFSSFDSKFKKILDKSLPLPGHNESFKSKFFCKTLIQLLCTGMKVRSVWNFTDTPVVNQLNSHASFTVFKWKWSSGSKNFSKKKYRLKELSGLQKKTARIQNQMPCAFWSRFFKKSSNTKNQTLIKKTQRIEKLKPSQQNLKGFSTKNNLKIYRESFLIFLKEIQNHHKFTSLVALKIQKSLFKTSLWKHESEFWKTLTFRVMKPMHLEISYNLLKIIYLYSPQRVNFPFNIDLEILNRSLR